MTDETDAAPEVPSAAEIFTLSLSGQGIQLNREVDRTAALEILAIAMAPAGSIAQAPASRSAGPEVAGPSFRASTTGEDRISVREYLNSVEAKRNPDKILAIGRFLQEHRHQETFTSDQVKSQFRSASEPLPGNYARDFRWTVSNGWIAEDHEATGEYYVTSSGKEALAAHFSLEVKKKSGVTKGRRKKKAPVTEGA